MIIHNTDYENSDYKINDGTCYIWIKGTSLNLKEGEKISLYWQGGGDWAGQCRKFLCTKLYSEFESIDANGNNNINLKHSSQCKFEDR